MFGCVRCASSQNGSNVDRFSQARIFLRTSITCDKMRVFPLTFCQHHLKVRRSPSAKEVHASNSSVLALCWSVLAPVTVSSSFCRSNKWEPDAAPWPHVLVRQSVVAGANRLASSLIRKCQRRPWMLGLCGVCEHALQKWILIEHVGLF